MPVGQYHAGREPAVVEFGALPRIGQPRATKGTTPRVRFASCYRIVLIRLSSAQSSARASAKFTV